MSSEAPYKYDRYKGHHLVLGNIIPQIFGASSYKLALQETLPLSDRGVFGLSFKTGETMTNQLSDTMSIGDSVIYSESLPISDQSSIGDSILLSETLTASLSESVVITNA